MVNEWYRRMIPTPEKSSETYLDELPKACMPVVQRADWQRLTDDASALVDDRALSPGEGV